MVNSLYRMWFNFILLPLLCAAGEKGKKQTDGAVVVSSGRPPLLPLEQTGQVSVIEEEERVILTLAGMAIVGVSKLVLGKAAVGELAHCFGAFCTKVAVTLKALHITGPVVYVLHELTWMNSWFIFFKPGVCAIRMRGKFGRRTTKASGGRQNFSP